MVVDQNQRIRVMEDGWVPIEEGRAVVDEGSQEDPFYVMDLGEVLARYHRWRELMPRVEPFYAVKCNDDRRLVGALAALGAGFDCASRAEIELVTALGVEPQRIIFANPAKMASHIKYASRVGVNVMTFDSETELMKIKQLMPHAQLVIRIRCDASAAQCPLGIKFGCDPVSEAPRLLKLAALMQLQVIGVSFHVGSGARETAVYGRGIQMARALFARGTQLGLRMTLLDIGGGFAGGSHDSLVETAEVVNCALEQHFPERGVRVVAEPGRYFAAAAYTLFTMLHAKRDIVQKDSAGIDQTHTMYFINDGVYGSFNCVLYDHQVVVPHALEGRGSGKCAPCSVWGPSCDALDCVVGAAWLPPLGAGQWLVWRDMGAYTLPVASAFNGFPVPRARAYISRAHWLQIKDLWPLTEADFVFDERVPAESAESPPPLSPELTESPESPESPGSSVGDLSGSLESLELEPLPPPVFVECALK